MARLKCFASFGLLLIALSSLTMPAAAAALIKAQAPCVDASLPFCLAFTSNQSVPTIRHFSFNAPSKGTAMVTFHGSMNCFSNAATNVVFEFASQIVTNIAVLADPRGPGGLDQRAFSIDRAVVPFNLASTRTFKINAAGTQDYYFKLKKIQMTSATACQVFNAAFTVNFVP